MPSENQTKPHIGSELFFFSIFRRAKRVIRNLRFVLCVCERDRVNSRKRNRENDINKRWEWTYTSSFFAQLTSCKQHQHKLITLKKYLSCERFFLLIVSKNSKTEHFFVGRYFLFICNKEKINNFLNKKNSQVIQKQQQ